MSKEAYCNVCGNPVFVSDIVDSNLKSLYDVYRMKKGLISIDEVRAIPEKYGIGKIPLSLLLGWEEQTFSRYYNGDIPNRHHSDILKKIYCNGLDDFYL